MAMFWAGNAFASKRVALVVGNAKYTGIAALNNPVNDAPDMAQALRNIGFEVLERTNVSMGDFNNALADFSRMSQGADTALFFYAGHGVQYEGKSYLLPVDITVQGGDDIDLKGVSQEKVLRAMRGGSVKIVILDACRDNPIARQTASRGLGGGDSTTRGLSRIDITEGMVIAYAAAPGATADDGAGRNSPFTAALVRRIQEPGVEIQAMFQNVRRDVWEKTNKKQMPEVNNSLLDDFYLSPIQGDASAWARISDSDKAQDFADFIQRYPTSAHRPNAEYRLQTLNRLARDNGESKRVLAPPPSAKKDEDDPVAKLQELQALLDRTRKRIEDDRKAEEEARRKQQDEAARAQQEAERLRLAEEQKVKQEAERKRQDDLRLAQEEVARKKAAIELAAREEAARRKEAADLAARQEAERRQAEINLKVQQEAERKRLIEEQKTQKAAAERQKLEEQMLAQQQEAARKKQEAELKAQQDAERKRLEDEQKRQLAETERQKAESERLARKAEADRKKQDEESDRQRVAEICSRDAADLGRYVVANDKTSVEAMRGQSKCPSVVSEIDKAVRKIDASIKLVCDFDRKALKAAGSDVEAMRRARDAMTCEPAKAEATQLVAQAIDELAACTDVRARFIAIDRTALNARQELDTLSPGIACVSLRTEIGTAVSEIETRASKVQASLKNLACYSGSVTGKFDAPTVQGIGRYFDVRGMKVDDPHVTEEFARELASQPRNLCKPGESEAPVAARPVKKEKAIAKARDSEEGRPVVARQRANPEPAAPRPAPVVVTHSAPPAAAPRLNVGGISF